MEKCTVHGTEMDLPIELIENPEIFSQVLSLDTWKCALTPGNRKHLKKFLPVLPTDYPHAQEENLRSLFGGENFKFGNPLETFQKKLQAGLYTSDIVNYRKRCKAAKIKAYKLKLKKFYRKLVNDVLISRQEIIDQVVSNSRQDTPITLSWNEHRTRQSSFPGASPDSKYKKIIKEVKDECEDQGISSDDEASDMHSHEQYVFNGSYVPHARYLAADRDSLGSTLVAVSTPYEPRPMVSDEDYHRMLQSHKRKRNNSEAFPELDTEAITLEDIISRTNVTARRSSKTVVKRKYKVKVKEKREQKKKLKRKRPVPNLVPRSVVSPGPTPVAAAAAVPKIEPFETMNEDATTDNVKRHETRDSGCPCFFSLLRDIFLDLPDATAELDQLERMVADWQQSSSCAASAWNNKERTWIDQIPSALKFLAGSGKEVSNCPSYIPMVIFKQKVHQWKWIGTFRDKDSDLVPLFEHWLETKDKVVSTTQASAAATTARTEYVVGPSSVVEKSEYQIQERQRYDNPHKPFIYRMHGFESIVAPVKGVFTKESNLNKAREHSLLVSKRPPYVTILTLVRDAAARLPNGEGTRAEVCLLLKDSQYINPIATDGQIHTVVSGALDRLHYEKDPCVKYDNARKVWIYLHKTRTMEEFEKLHEASAAAARAKKQQNQKQKLLKQQQKAKEATCSIPDLSLSSTAADEAETTSVNLSNFNVVPSDAAKPKKPAKPKRPPSSNPKNKDKTKTKPKLESLDTRSQNIPSISQPPPMPTISVLSPMQSHHTLQQPASLGQLAPQDQNPLHNLQSGSNFQRLSRLNTPYVPVDQPVQENSSVFGEMSKSSDVINYGSGSSHFGDSDSDTESSGIEGGVSPQGPSISQHQDPSLQYGEQRIPFNNVMSLFQQNADGTDRNNTFGGF